MSLLLSQLSTPAVTYKPRLTLMRVGSWIALVLGGLYANCR